MKAFSQFKGPKQGVEVYICQGTGKSASKKRFIDLGILLLHKTLNW